MRRPRAAPRTALQFASPGRTLPSERPLGCARARAAFWGPTMTTSHLFNFVVLSTLVGGRCGRFDVPCPACGPLCRAASNRRRPVLRVWREEAEFISFYRARCGQRGFAKDCESPPLRPRAIGNAPRPERLRRSSANTPIARGTSDGRLQFETTLNRSAARSLSNI